MFNEVREVREHIDYLLQDGARCADITLSLLSEIWPVSVLNQFLPLHPYVACFYLPIPFFHCSHLPFIPLLFPRTFLPILSSTFLYFFPPTTYTFLSSSFDSSVYPFPSQCVLTPPFGSDFCGSLSFHQALSCRLTHVTSVSTFLMVSLSLHQQNDHFPF